MERVCKSCNESKTLEAFRKSNTCRLSYSYTCLSCDKIRLRQNYYKYKEDRLTYAKEYQKTARYKSYQKLYQQGAGKLASRLRTRLYNALRSSEKKGSFVKELGCTLDEFKAYLESKFKPGMTWENWGRKGWHIDHIKPLASFDLSDPIEFLKACHYTNMQPLWGRDNLSKGARLSV